MPRVPTYDGPQVELAPLRAPNLDSVVSPELLGANAKQGAQLAQGVMNAGSGLAAVAYQMKQRDDADSVFRAETALKDEYLKVEQDWRQNRQGRFAKDLTTDAGKWWDERVKHHSGNLANEDQRRAFQQRSASTRNASMSSVSHYEAVQLERSHDEAWKADKNATISQAAQAPTPQNIENARMEIDRLNRYQAARKGWEPQVLENEKLQDTTSLHESVIKGMARTDPVGAKAYFDANKKEIDGRRHDEIGGFADKVSASAIGEQAADAIWKQMRPQADADPVELDKMEEKAREALKGNESAMKAAIQALRERTSAHDKGQSERQAGNVNAVMSLFRTGASMPAIERSPAFQALPGAKQAELQEHIASIRHTRQGRGIESLAREERLKQIKYGAAYNRYSDPDVLKGMSRLEVEALEPTLGQAYTHSLVTKWDSISKSETKVLEARVDRDDFNTVAESAGLEPFKVKKSDEDKAALGNMQARIEQIIDAEQTKAKRLLTRSEKMMIMQREIDNQVLVDKTFWFDPKKPAMLLSKDELKNAYVVVDGKEVKLSSIPADDRAAIISARRARGLPITEQAIAQTWARSRPKKAPAPVPAIAPGDYDPNKVVP